MGTAPVALRILSLLPREHPRGRCGEGDPLCCAALCSVLPLAHTTSSRSLYPLCSPDQGWGRADGVLRV